MLLGRSSFQRAQRSVLPEQQSVRRCRKGIVRRCTAGNRVPAENVDAVEQVLLQRQLRKDRSKNLQGPVQVKQSGSHDKQKALNDKESAADAPARKRLLLSPSQLLEWERKGHLNIRSVLSESQVLKIRQAAEKAIEINCLEALRHRIRVLLPEHQQAEVKSKQQGLQHLRAHSRELGFLQHFNLHR